MEDRPTNEFGKRRPSTIAPTGVHPVKRSRHVALLLMGTLAVGGGGYAMMGSRNCEPNEPGMAGPALPQTGECGPRGSSSSGGRGGSGGSWSRSSFFGGDPAGGRLSSSTADSGSGETTRGGFGSFARSLGLHFSGS